MKYTRFSMICSVLKPRKSAQAENGNNAKTPTSRFDMYPPYWLSSKEGTYHFFQHFVGFLFAAIIN